MTDWRPDRRAYLASLTAAAATLAGCASSSDTPTTTTDTSTATSDGTEAARTTEATEQNGESGQIAPVRPDFDGWLDGGDGRTEVAYGHDEVTVTIQGYKQYQFDPVAIQVDPGATVRWRNETDNSHIIAAEDGRFETERFEPGDSVEQTFEEAGIHRYVCRPHRALGSVGAVVVGTDYPTVLPDAPLAWYTDTYSAYGQPVVGEDTVYAVSAGELTAFATADGTERWTRTTTADPENIAVTSDSVYIADEDGVVRALDATDGSERWQQATETDLESWPAVHGETVVVGGQRGLVQAYDTGGERLWKRELAADYIPELTLADGAVYAAGGEQGRGHLYELDLGTGETNWAYRSDDVQSTFLAPVVSNGTAFTKAFHGSVHAVSTSDGAREWTVSSDLGGGHQSSPVVSEGRVYVKRDARTVVAVDAGSGEQVWEYGPDAVLTGIILAARSAVYVADDHGVSAVDAGTGEVSQRYPSEEVYWVPATGVSGSRAFVGSWGVWALDATPESASGRPSLPVSTGSATFLGDWDSGVFVVS